MQKARDRGPCLLLVVFVVLGGCSGTTGTEDDPPEVTYEGRISDVLADGEAVVYALASDVIGGCSSASTSGVDGLVMVCEERCLCDGTGETCLEILPTQLEVVASWAEPVVVGSTITVYELDGPSIEGMSGFFALRFSSQTLETSCVGPIQFHTSRIASESNISDNQESAEAIVQRLGDVPAREPVIETWDDLQEPAALYGDVECWTCDGE